MENGVSSPKKGSGGFVRTSHPRLIIPACGTGRPWSPERSCFDLLFQGNPRHALVTVPRSNNVCVAVLFGASVSSCGFHHHCFLHGDSRA